MRIAHFVSTFPPYQGGMGNVCFYQVKELAELNYQMTVFTPDYGRDKFQTSNFNFQIVYLKSVLKYGNAAFIPQVTEYLKNFEIIHLHYPFFGGAEIIWWYFLKPRKAKLVVQYHMDFVPPQSLNLSRLAGIVLNGYNRLLTPLIFRKASKILVSSNDYALNSKIIRSFFLSHQEKFLEIPLGVNSQHFQPQDKKNKKLMERWQILPEELIILFVGGLDKAHYFKGVNVLLQATAKLKIKNEKLRIKFIVVGEGELRSKYEKLADELKIKDWVIFAGQVSNEDLPDYYNLADVFVLPSINHSEAFGLVLLEAMSCAKPVITSNLAGVRTVVENGTDGFLVKPRNPDDLVEKIKILLTNKELRRKMGQAGRKKIEEKYSWQEIVKELEKLYKTLILK